MNGFLVVDLAAQREQQRAPRHELKQTTRQVAGDQREFNSIRCSHSYRFGHAALQPARWIKRTICNVVGHPPLAGR